MCNSHHLKISRGKLLDFGCGVGRMTRAFASFFDSCTGVDVSENIVAFAREYNADVSHCEFVTNKSVVLPFADRNFDFIFSVLVLQHLPTKAMIQSYIAEFIECQRKWRHCISAPD